jgi:hypothetical protein
MAMVRQAVVGRIQIKLTGVSSHKNYTKPFSRYDDYLFFGKTWRD